MEHNKRDGDSEVETLRWNTRRKMEVMVDDGNKHKRKDGSDGG